MRSKWNRRCLLLVLLTLSVPSTAREFVRGDSNRDGSTDISDAVFGLAWLFSGGDEPGCLDAADTNDSGSVDLSDSVYLLGFLFQGGPSLPPPVESCGEDPVEDELSCVSYPCGGVGPSPTSVQETLDALAVNTSYSDRIDADGSVLPDDFAPLGSRVALAQTNELFLVGLQREGVQRRLDLVDFALEGSEPVARRLGRANLIDAPWTLDSRSGVFERHRDAAAADVDGDGIDELCVAYRDPSGTGVSLDVIEDTIRDASNSAQANAAVRTVSLLQSDSWDDVSIVAGDFDGDGLEELAIAVSGTDAARLLIHDDAEAGFAVLVDQDISLGIAFGDENWVELAVGNIDRDRHDELALVRGAYSGSSSSAEGACAYLVLDDLARGSAQLDSGRVEFNAGEEQFAVAADIALGDIDGDGIDEIVIGGLLEFTYDECRPIAHMAQILDDSAHGLVEIDRRVFLENFWLDACRDDPGRPNLTRFVHVNTVDLHGDGADEIQMNEVIWSDWRDSQTWTEVLRLPREVLAPENGWDVGVTLGRVTSTIVAADVIGLAGDVASARRDGAREQLTVWAQWTGKISVWGVDGLLANGWSELGSVPTELYNADSHVRPIVLPADVQADGPMLRYDQASYEFAFSEPIVLAVIAAAPCQFDITQNISFCNTVYGTETSETIGSEDVISWSVGTKWGAEIPIVDDIYKVSAEEELTSTTREITGSAYELSRWVTYTTGAAEDSVVFMTVPLDVYTYTILSHPDDPSLVGTSVTVALPRSPIETIVTLETYNASVRDPSLRIDIFDHTPGDIASYPTRNAATRGPSIQSEERTVGQGGGTVEVGIRVSEESSSAEALATDFTMSMETNGVGIIGGVTVGTGEESTITITHGEATTYAGIVGSIADRSLWNQYAYAFGLVVYTHREPGREFEVVGYWVNPNPPNEG